MCHSQYLICFVHPASAQRKGAPTPEWLPLLKVPETKMLLSRIPNVVPTASLAAVDTLLSSCLVRSVSSKDLCAAPGRRDGGQARCNASPALTSCLRASLPPSSASAGPHPSPGLSYGDSP